MASDEYPLHASVFEGDKRRVAQLIRTHDLGQKDLHGNPVFLIGLCCVTYPVLSLTSISCWAGSFDTDL